MPPITQSTLALLAAASAGGWSRDLLAPAAGELLRICLALLPREAGPDLERRPLEPEGEIDIEFLDTEEEQQINCSCPLEDAVAGLDPGRQAAVAVLLRENMGHESLVAIGIFGLLRMVCVCRLRAAPRVSTRRRVGSSLQEPEW